MSFNFDIDIKTEDELKYEELKKGFLSPPPQLTLEYARQMIIEWNEYKGWKTKFIKKARADVIWAQFFRIQKQIAKKEGLR